MNRPLSVEKCPQVMARMCLSRSGLYARTKSGEFPPPIKIGKRASAWPSHEVDAVLAARIAGMSDESIKSLVRELVKARQTAETAL